MVEHLLTKEEVAQHFQVDKRTIDRWRVDGVLPACNIPGTVRFNPKDVAKLDGSDISPLSPIERKRLERELNSVTQERDYYKNILDEMSVLSAKAILKKG